MRARILSRKPGPRTRLSQPAEKMKSTKVQTLGELRMRIGGLGYLYAFTRGLPLVARRECDMG